jgi:hypothetical protein
MITLFAMPKPFLGHIGMIQRNAIRSWTLLQPRPEIILFGDDEGTRGAAVELGVLHSPEVRRNSSGTPLVSDFFAKASAESSAHLLCYINADIILLGDFPETVNKLATWQASFLASGRRWDLTVDRPLNFEHPEWQTGLQQRVRTEGFHRPPNWVDYFVFDKKYTENLPPFAIGRTCWDNWLVWHALDSGRPVVDLSERVLAVHQNHDYAHHKAGAVGVWQGQEAQENLRIAGGRRRLSTMLEATHVFGANGPEPRKGHKARSARRYVDGLKLDLQMSLLEWTRPLRTAMGLRKKSS